MICDVIHVGIALDTFFEIQDGSQVLCTVSKFKAFSRRFENDGNRTKADLVTVLLLLNARDLGKTITPASFLQYEKFQLLLHIFLLNKH